jgi:hypothetical protein
VTPFVTGTALPTPDLRPRTEDVRPRIVDVSTGAARTLDLGVGLFFEHLMSDGSILASDGSGQLEAVSRDGQVLAQYSNRNGDPALTYSSDSRYAAWYDGHGLKVYDAVSHDVSVAVPAGAKFPRQLADGSVILCAQRECDASVLLSPSGAFARTLPKPGQAAGAISPDGARVAWPGFDGLHVYGPAAGSDRVYAPVQWVVGDLAWSPDGARIAYERLTGDNAVHVVVIALASGAEREVFTGKPRARIDAMTFVTNTRISLAVETEPARPDVPATTYAFNIDGSQAGMTPGTRPWSTCGPACGLPPASDVGPGGIASWCEAPPANAPPNAGCTAHVVKVDRAAGTTRDLFTASGAYSDALSPDGTTLAAVVIDPKSFDTVIHLIDLSTYADRAYPIDLRVSFADLQWFPDGRDLLLALPGGM